MITTDLDVKNRIRQLLNNPSNLKVVSIRRLHPKFQKCDKIEATCTLGALHEISVNIAFDADLSEVVVP